MKPGTRVWVLWDRHGDGSIAGVVAKELAALKWQEEDPRYRAFVECELLAFAVDPLRPKANGRPK